MCMYDTFLLIKTDTPNKFFIIARTFDIKQIKAKLSG